MVEEELFGLMFVVAMFSGVFVIFLGLRQRSQHLEMQHRERMAMIGRGQIPLTDPSVIPLRRGRVGLVRSSSLGIIVVGLGLGLATIISVAGGAPRPASASAVRSPSLAPHSSSAPVVRPTRIRRSRGPPHALDAGSDLPPTQCLPAVNRLPIRPIRPRRRGGWLFQFDTSLCIGSESVDTTI